MSYLTLGVAPSAPKAQHKCKDDTPSLHPTSELGEMGTATGNISLHTLAFVKSAELGYDTSEGTLD